MSLFDYDSFRDAVRATRVQPRRYDAPFGTL